MHKAIKVAVSEYTSNYLPVYLLDLQSMRLTHRSTFSEHFKSELDEFILHRVPQDLGKETEDVESLDSEATTWIKDRTEYAILSHRWGNNELNFSDISQFAKFSIGGGPDEFTALGNLNKIPTKVSGLAKDSGDGYGPFELLHEMEHLCDNNTLQGYEGFVKLIRFFTKSHQYGCHYVWFDTGCIDKSSSAELEESIRSMFNWYRNSKICIIHLSSTASVRSLRNDPWFTRGWTLQELLAPLRVKFFDRSWQPIISTSFPDNDKLDISAPHREKDHLWNHVSDITQISLDHFRNFIPGIHLAREALSWLSGRHTTRVEDMTYCLIGLLRIPLSIAYGEGKQAFYRLQVELLQRTPDMGLFNWKGDPAPENSMLASEPRCFSSPLIRPLFPPSAADPLSLTNYGLRIPLSVYNIGDPKRFRVDGGKLVRVKIEEFSSTINARPKASDEYEKVELAVLGQVLDKQGFFAILLGSTKDRCVRIPTYNTINVPLPIRGEWKKPETRFIL